MTGADAATVEVTVTAPVAPDIEMPVPATMLVTPVLDNVTVPPSDTGLPATPKPVPPVTVIDPVTAVAGIFVKPEPLPM